MGIFIFGLRVFTTEERFFYRKNSRALSFYITFSTRLRVYKKNAVCFVKNVKDFVLFDRFLSGFFFSKN